MNTIAVIDYGMGNLHSVSKALIKVSPLDRILVTSDIGEIEKADKIVLPGVGAIKECMEALCKDKLHEVTISNMMEKPTLAICVGMQMLLESSEENGGIKGLNLIDGKVRRISNSETVKVPHMGWNQVSQKSNHYMWTDIPDNSFFYFVHSYACDSSLDAIGLTSHGSEFISAVSRKNIFAVQFHPEKSQKAGLQLYKNFINWEID
jgi:glutamine amidotransferase